MSKIHKTFKNKAQRVVDALTCSDAMLSSSDIDYPYTSIDKLSWFCKNLVANSYIARVINVLHWLGYIKYNYKTKFVHCKRQIDQDFIQSFALQQQEQALTQKLCKAMNINYMELDSEVKLKFAVLHSADLQFVVTMPCKVKSTIKTPLTWLHVHFDNDTDILKIDTVCKNVPTSTIAWLVAYNATDNKIIRAIMIEQEGSKIQQIQKV